MHQPMRFTIEQRHLTDNNGRPITAGTNVVRFHSCEAGDADEAVRLFIRDHHAEIIGNILQFPGFQAVATMRNPEGVFTLQIAPTSQSMRIR
jgi:hypothetical protein